MCNWRLLCVFFVQGVKEARPWHQQGWEGPSPQTAARNSSRRISSPRSIYSSFPFSWEREPSSPHCYLKNKHPQITCLCKVYIYVQAKSKNAQCLLCYSTSYLKNVRVKAAAHSTLDVLEQSSERRHCGKIQEEGRLFCCNPFCRVIVTDLGCIKKMTEERLFSSFT